jgi:hypothetical protein
MWVNTKKHQGSQTPTGTLLQFADHAAMAQALGMSDKLMFSKMKTRQMTHPVLANRLGLACRDRGRLAGQR